MRLFIDGDSCPVKNEIYTLTNKHTIPVTLVSNFSHHSLKELPPHVTTIYVDSGADSADYRILSLATKNDIIVTQDFGLASLLLEKQCAVIHYTGSEYSKQTIDFQLATRELNSKLRRSGKKIKGPKPYTESLRTEFITKLEEIIQHKKKLLSDNQE